MSTRLEIGSPAPSFTLKDAQGQDVSLSDFAGRRVVVYFYPAAMTPGCTIQAIDFTAAVSEFERAGYAVVGISPDTVEKLATFREKEALGIPLLADPDRVVHDAYGTYGKRMLYGKEVEGVIRSTFVIEVDDDGNGTIQVAQYNVKATGHVDKLKRDLGI
ncbi:thioredoxin-dependent thiol peroxidase [Aestuariimicrobium ganziense]|uniref:thioredoxin-dependent thiol peroxidase n=1 Tax=Aestuariimicrobium ganziense TaxID=2773677 RepID=UPI00194265C9|nr:thioredoxin-dependent thiol peroxidase [Aestuariimicrobium ganziense]